MIKSSICILIFFLAVLSSYAQVTDSLKNKSISELSLEDLLNMQTTTGSKIAIPLVEAPGVITVINSSEIERSGARSLMELLRQVPGLEFGTEWDNIIGIGIRGNNATEGKILVMLDGHQLNETNFGIFPFGNHIQLDNVSYIEVVRGPGSVNYGGSAELAVINIVSKKGKDLQGGYGSFGYGISDGASLKYTGQIGYGEAFDNSMEYSIHANYGISNRSNRNFYTLDQKLIAYKDSSRITSTNINLNINYKGLEASFLYDNNIIDNTEATGQVKFDGLFSRLAYKHVFKDILTVNPQISWSKQKPWYFLNYSEKEFYNSVNNRFIAMLPVEIKFKKLSIIAGIGYYYDISNKEDPNTTFTINGQRKFSVSNLSSYLELFYRTKFVNIIAGGRYELNSIYGGAFAPRLALTKKFNRFGYKLLITQAFKAPTISNLDYNSDIKPERTLVFEVELFMQPTSDMFLSVNAFNMYIDDPILYIPNPETGADYYTNFEKSGSKGIEVTAKKKENWGSISFAYSYYLKSNNLVPCYNVEGHKWTYGAFPQHKASLMSSFNIWKGLSLNQGFYIYGKRYTYVHSKPDWSEAELIEYPESMTMDVFLLFKDMFVNGLDFSFGVYNLTANNYDYINSYQGWQNPIPSPGREFYLKLKYRFERKDKK